MFYVAQFRDYEETQESLRARVQWRLSKETHRGLEPPKEMHWAKWFQYEGDVITDWEELVNHICEHGPDPHEKKPEEVIRAFLIDPERGTVQDCTKRAIKEAGWLHYGRTDKFPPWHDVE